MSTDMKQTEFVLPSLTHHRRAKLLSYAKRALSAEQRMLNTQGENIVHYTLNDQEKHLHLQHYPKGDRIDKQTGAQYFYHCHRENFDAFEHGHFHCFMRYPQIPKHIKPKSIPDWDKYMDNPMTHLVAISMSQYGKPIRLFTVNRWISSEIWYDSKYINRNLSLFKMSLTDNPYWQVLDDWIESILNLFSPQIIWLHQQRDEMIKQLEEKQQYSNNAISVYEDSNIEELSSISIDIQTQIQWLLEGA